MKTLHTLFALVLLTLSLNAGQAFGQSIQSDYDETVDFARYITLNVQDGAKSIEVEGNFEIAFLDSAQASTQPRDQDVHIELVSLSWRATTDTGRFDFDEGSLRSGCKRGEFKEATADVDGLSFTIHLCSTEDGPLIVEPHTAPRIGQKKFTDHIYAYQAHSEQLGMSISTSSR